MERNEAVKFCRSEMDKYSLNEWGIRLTTDESKAFLGLCSYKDKVIILNAHHIDIHPDYDVIDTVRHEIAHCLTEGHRHDNVWREKAREIGCNELSECSSLTLTPELINAIRSGATLEYEIEEQIIRVPKYKVTRLQDKCEFCGKVAKESSSYTELIDDISKPDKKYIFLECGHLIVKNIFKGTPFHTLKSDDGKTPFKFQVEGMEFIETALSINKGAAVLDEMGLGKTVQSLGYLKFHPEALPVLFIVKSGIKFQWFKEILRWMGPEYVAQIISTSSDFIIPNLKCYIASYDIFVFKTRKSSLGKTITQGMDVDKFIQAGIKTIVLDECQQIKNPDSSRTQAIRKIAKVTNVIGLSGTPWKNRGSEFFSLLNMIAPTKFYSYQNYLDRWVNFYINENNKKKEGGIKHPDRFKEYIKDIAIRRERSEVMADLPLINRMKLHVQLNDIENDTYNEEEESFVKWYQDKVIGGNEDDGATGMQILAKMSRMRHLTGLAKIPATVSYVEDFIEETDRKLVIFVHHKDVASILIDELKRLVSSDESYKSIPVLSLDASLSSEERFMVQERFNNTERCIMIASTLASGEGLNLQTCADCIMHERQWNPANEEQAEGRFIRIGQMSKSVNGTYVEATGTIDEHLDGIVERKRSQFHEAMNKGEAPVWNQSDLTRELAETIVKKFRDKTKNTELKDRLTKMG